jgi:predicted nucleic acid-binding protein
LIVVDASVAVQWVAKESTSELSETLLSRSDLIAPDLLLVEAANALYRKVFVGDISHPHATAGLEYIRDKVALLPVTIPILSQAIELSVAMNHAVYDCIYLVIAESTGSLLVTYDQELRDHATYHGHGGLITDLPLAVS